MNPKLLLSDISSINECSVQFIHKILKENKEIEFQKEQNRIFVQNSGAKFLIKKEIPKKTIAIQTVKGGVGKTTMALSLGIRFWLLGAKVLFIDIDQQGNLSKTCGHPHPEYVLHDIFEKKVDAADAVVKIKDNLDILPSSIKNALLNQYMLAYSIREEKAIKGMVKKFQKDYDIIIIDCPPAIGPSVTAATIASDMVIAPLDPDDYAIDGVKFCLQEVNKINTEYDLNIDFKILLNKYDARTILSGDIVTLLQDSNNYKKYLFQTIISVSQEFTNSKARKETIFCSLRQGKACKDIDSLSREILGWPMPKERGE
jgi:chromosome partitioning protein